MTIGKDLKWEKYKPLIDKSTMKPFEFHYQHFSQCYLDAERTKLIVSGGHKESVIVSNTNHVFMVDIKTGFVSKLASMI
mgnify:CR=1 FL=1